MTNTTIYSSAVSAVPCSGLDSVRPGGTAHAMRIKGSRFGAFSTPLGAAFGTDLQIVEDVPGVLPRGVPV